MHPTLIQLDGPAGVHTYGLFIALAFAAAFIYVYFRAIRIGLHPDRLLGAYISAAVGGLVGARVLYAIAVDFEATLANPLSLFSFAGFAVYGGVMGGAIGVVGFALATGINTWKLADIAGPAVLLGMGIGRLGCLSAGCCHGAAAPIGTDPISLLPEAFGGQIYLSGVAPFVTTQFDSAAGGVTRAALQDLPLYPTQMWAVLTLLPLAALLSWLWTKRRFDGQIIALTMMVEPVFRSLIESFRADHRGYAIELSVSESLASWLPGLTQAGSDAQQTMMGITTSQFIGIIVMGTGLTIYILRRNAGLAAETPVDTSDTMLEGLD